MPASSSKNHRQAILPNLDEESAMEALLGLEEELGLMKEDEEEFDLKNFK